MSLNIFIYVVCIFFIEYFDFGVYGASMVNRIGSGKFTTGCWELFSKFPGYLFIFEDYVVDFYENKRTFDLVNF